jgi:hypothetical protein
MFKNLVSMSAVQQRILEKVACQAMGQAKRLVWWGVPAAMIGENAVYDFVVLFTVFIS